MTETIVAIGTRKGLWIARSTDRQDWTLEGPHFLMSEVASVAIDTREGRSTVLAGVKSWHWGPTVQVSTDGGRTWTESAERAVAFPADTDTALERIWQLTPDPNDSDVVWAGVEPHALFKSTDRGEKYELVRGLWDHPHRPTWEPGFGGGAVHTIVPEPGHPENLLVAMSAGGVYRSGDSGATWEPSNPGIRAGFNPEDEYPEYGQCVHKIAMNPRAPERFFAQVHHGVYRSEDGAASWQSIADGLPSDFGFPMVVHPHRPEVIYNFPLQADAMRFPPEGRCRVYRSEDLGKSWDALGVGLPDGFWAGVMRDAMCADDADPAGVYFGSRTGEVYASGDEGESWRQVVSHLPDVLTVRAATV